MQRFLRSKVTSNRMDQYECLLSWLLSFRFLVSGSSLDHNIVMVQKGWRLFWCEQVRVQPSKCLASIRIRICRFTFSIRR